MGALSQESVQHHPAGHHHSVLDPTFITKVKLFFTRDPPFCPPISLSRLQSLTNHNLQVVCIKLTYETPNKPTPQKLLVLLTRDNHISCPPFKCLWQTATTVVLHILLYKAYTFNFHKLAAGSIQPGRVREISSQWGLGALRLYDSTLRNSFGMSHYRISWLHCMKTAHFSSFASRAIRREIPIVGCSL